MDEKLLGQAVSFHGPDFLRQLQLEQQNVPPNIFLHLQKHRPQVPEINDQQLIMNVRRFISKKADMLFAPMSEEDKIKMTPTDDEDSYAKMPPIETFMGIDPHTCRQHLFQSLQNKDIIIGVVNSVLDTGLVLTLLCMDQGKNRDIDDLKISAFIPVKEIPEMFPSQNPVEGYQVKDFIRGVVLSVNPETESVIISLIDKLLEGSSDDKPTLGLIHQEDFPVEYRRKLHIRGLTFDELLNSILGFTNTGSVPYLLGVMGQKEAASLMRGLNSLKIPDKEYAENLRKQQSQKWAYQSVAQGIAFFKEGRQTEAMQQLNRALQIDKTNVEALVARGALYANNESYSRALQDFDEALESNPKHPNAIKYMHETLLAKGKCHEDDGNWEEADQCYKKALVIVPESQEAKESIRYVQYKMDAQGGKGDGRKVKRARSRSKSRSPSPLPYEKTTETLKKLIDEEKKVSRSKKKRSSYEADVSDGRKSKQHGRQRYSSSSSSSSSSSRSRSRDRYSRKSRSQEKTKSQERYRKSSTEKHHRNKSRSKSPGKGEFWEPEERSERDQSSYNFFSFQRGQEKIPFLSDSPPQESEETKGTAGKSSEYEETDEYKQLYGSNPDLHNDKHSENLGKDRQNKSRVEEERKLKMERKSSPKYEKSRSPKRHRSRSPRYEKSRSPRRQRSRSMERLAIPDSGNREESITPTRDEVNDRLGLEDISPENNDHGHEDLRLRHISRLEQERSEKWRFEDKRWSPDKNRSYESQDRMRKASWRSNDETEKRDRDKGYEVRTVSVGKHGTYESSDRMYRRSSGGSKERRSPDRDSERQTHSSNTYYQQEQHERSVMVSKNTKSRRDSPQEFDDENSRRFSSNYDRRYSHERSQRSNSPDYSHSTRKEYQKQRSKRSRSRSESPSRSRKSYKDISSDTSRHRFSPETSKRSSRGQSKRSYSSSSSSSRSRSRSRSYTQKKGREEYEKRSRDEESSEFKRVVIVKKDQSKAREDARAIDKSNMPSSSNKWKPIKDENFTEKRVIHIGQKGTPGKMMEEGRGGMVADIFADLPEPRAKDDKSQMRFATYVPRSVKLKQQHPHEKGMNPEHGLNPEKLHQKGGSDMYEQRSRDRRSASPKDKLRSLNDRYIVSYEHKGDQDYDGKVQYQQEYKKMGNLGQASPNEKGRERLSRSRSRSYDRYKGKSKKSKESNKSRSRSRSHSPDESHKMHKKKGSGKKKKKRSSRSRSRDKKSSIDTRTEGGKSRLFPVQGEEKATSQFDASTPVVNPVKVQAVVPTIRSRWDSPEDEKNSRWEGEDKKVSTSFDQMPLLVSKAQEKISSMLMSNMISTSPPPHRAMKPEEKKAMDLKWEQLKENVEGEKIPQILIDARSNFEVNSKLGKKKMFPESKNAENESKDQGESKEKKKKQRRKSRFDSAPDSDNEQSRSSKRTRSRTRSRSRSKSRTRRRSRSGSRSRRRSRSGSRSRRRSRSGSRSRRRSRSGSRNRRRSRSRSRRRSRSRSKEHRFRSGSGSRQRSRSTDRRKDYSRRTRDHREISRSRSRSRNRVSRNISDRFKDESKDSPKVFWFHKDEINREGDKGHVGNRFNTGRGRFRGGWRGRGGRGGGYVWKRSRSRTKSGSDSSESPDRSASATGTNKMDTEITLPARSKWSSDSEGSSEDKKKPLTEESKPKGTLNELEQFLNKLKSDKKKKLEEKTDKS